LKKHYNIVARTNGVGLDQDVDLIRKTLITAGHEVTISHCRSRKRWLNIIPCKTKFDANIFIERVFPAWFGTAHKNYLIPNQERFPKSHTKRLKKIEQVLCKTHHAKKIFSQYSKSSYIGFTSTDRSIPNKTTDFQTYLHLAGRSTHKGTKTLIAVWKRHPEWPTLTIIQNKKNAPKEVPTNIKLITEYLTHETLKNHLNSHGVHLCPSISEGWGHYIVEAMSCSAVVLTTDAPPMNELIKPDRGILVPHYKSEPYHLGTNFYVDPDQLEKALTALIQSSTKTKQNLANKAQNWFFENNNNFAERFLKSLQPNS